MPLALLLLVGAGLGGALVLAAEQLAHSPPREAPRVLVAPDDCPLTLTLVLETGANHTAYVVEWLEHGPVPLAGLRYAFSGPEGAREGPPAGNVTDLPRDDAALRYLERSGAADSLDVGDAIVHAAEPLNLELSNGAGAFGGTMRCL